MEWWNQKYKVEQLDFERWNWQWIIASTKNFQGIKKGAEEGIDAYHKEVIKYIYISHFI